MSQRKESKVCVGCRLLLSRDNFYINHKRSSLRPRCKACDSKRLSSYQIIYKKVKWTPEARFKYRNKYKDIVYEHYGKVCVCCGEKEYLFLSLDHINNDGSIRRRSGEGVGLELYRWIIRNNFPQHLQVLCYNCNMGKSINKGICPHRRAYDTYTVSSKGH